MDGRLLDYGRHRRDAPRDLADHVIARDGTDRFPTSRVPARRCDLDHATPWEDGGGTDEANLNAVSPRAHQVRHDTGWSVGRRPDGSLRWTTATGRSAVTPVNQVGASHADRALAGVGSAGGSWLDPTDDVLPY